jgi:hypothetical protein
MIQVGVPVGLGSGWTRVRGARSHVACVRMDPQARCFQGGGHGMLFGAVWGEVVCAAYSERPFQPQ